MQNVLELSMRLVALCSGTVALTFRNDGSQSPDWWLNMSRNNHKVLSKIKSKVLFNVTKRQLGWLFLFHLQLFNPEDKLQKKPCVRIGKIIAEDLLYPG